MPASTRSPPGATCAHSSGASSFSGVARMLASTSGIAPCAASGSAGVRLHAVGLRIGARRIDRGRIDVDRIDAARAVQRGADREDARAAAVVEHARPRRALGCMVRDPAQAHARRRVGAGAERQPGSSRITLRRRGRRLVPARHDPELGVISTGANCDCVSRTQS